MSTSNKKSLVLLHGGMSSSASLLASVGPRLAKRFAVSAFDRRGHGRTGDTAAPFSYDDMAEETIAFLEHLGRRSHLVGHSDGGIVALKVALRRPDLVRRVVAIGANYHVDGLLPLAHIGIDSPEFVEWSLRFGLVSPDGPGHARIAFEKAQALFASEPTMTVEELSAMRVPTLIMAGDDDVATLAHTCSMYEAIPGAQLAIVPGTSHALLKERTRTCERIIRHYLTHPATPSTYMPVRRAAHG